MRGRDGGMTVTYARIGTSGEPLCGSAVSCQGQELLFVSLQQLHTADKGRKAEGRGGKG